MAGVRGLSRKFQSLNISQSDGKYDKSKEDTERLTPYQGKKKSWGEFECPSCGKKWSSGHSWANTGQECKECRINVYPHHQRRLIRSESSNNRPHLSSLCEMCKKLGRNCSTLRYNHSRDK